MTEWYFSNCQLQAILDTLMTRAIIMTVFTKKPYTCSPELWCEGKFSLVQCFFLLWTYRIHWIPIFIKQTWIWSQILTSLLWTLCNRCILLCVGLILLEGVTLTGSLICEQFHQQWGCNASVCLLHKIASAQFYLWATISLSKQCSLVGFCNVTSFAQTHYVVIVASLHP